MRVAELPYALAVASEVTFSRVNPPTSLDYALWDDGAGATVMEYDPRGNPKQGIIGTLSQSDGDNAGLLGMKGVGTDFPPGAQPDASLCGKGRRIQHYCLEHVPVAVRIALERSGEVVTPRTFFLPHNTNLRMVHRLGELIGVPEARTLTVLGDRGNQSSASIPVTLARYSRAQTFRSGDLLILAAFGGGMLISIILYRWP
jgi:3-oxoacyl-[acyl-carrier-protein] synthase-3